MSPRRRPHPAGFSLIEVMISMGLLAFSLVGLAQIQIAAVATNRLASKMNEASRSARDLIDAAKQWPIGDNRLASGTVEYSTRDELEAAVQTAIKAFQDGDTTVKPAWCQGCKSGESTNVDDYAAFAGPTLSPGFSRFWSTFTLMQNGKRAGRLIVVGVRFTIPGPNNQPVAKTAIQTAFRFDPNVFTDF